MLPPAHGWLALAGGHSQHSMGFEATCSDSVRPSGCGMWTRKTSRTRVFFRPMSVSPLRSSMSEFRSLRTPAQSILQADSTRMAAVAQGTLRPQRPLGPATAGARRPCREARHRACWQPAKGGGAAAGADGPPGTASFAPLPGAHAVTITLVSPLGSRDRAGPAAPPWSSCCTGPPEMPVYFKFWHRQPHHSAKIPNFLQRRMVLLNFI